MPENLDQPLVSVVTPVYNTGEYLEQCIKSVLSQTYRNLEYIILDNCSTDDSLAIANRYASIDNRIRVIQNSTFLNQIQNYNQSVRHISENSKYCKIVQADDGLYPDCLTQMVKIAESNQTIGMVGAFTLLDFGNRADVYLMGLPYSKSSYKGLYICRRYLLEGFDVFGSPTATLLRSKIVRSRQNLYNENSAVDDTSLCIEVLKSWDFGFCHQVLTYTRRDNESLMTILKQYNFHILTRYIILKKYGRDILSEDEYSKCEEQIEKMYHIVIGESILTRLPDEFWQFQDFALKEIDEKIDKRKKYIWAFQAAIELALNPKSTLERLTQHRKRKESSLDVEKYIDI
ncbi:MAG TPA: glycosyltransferase family 2 protein [Gammaproteobacteria bacterium]|nr:glycosyltransferase family 2 protein [Gammaproteobacteria bacterium]